MPSIGTLSQAETSGRWWRKPQGEQLGLWFSVLQEARCGRSSLVPSSGDSHERRKGILGPGNLGPRHWEEECQGENRLPLPSSGPGVNTLGSGTGASDARE